MKKTIILSLLLWCGIAHANQITEGPDAQAVFASATTITWTQIYPTAGVCPNSALFVDCGEDAGAVTKIQYAGLTMTQGVLQNVTESEMIYWLSASSVTGSNSVVATWGTAVNAICSSKILCNIKISTPIGSTSKADATSTNPSQSVVCTTSGSWILMGMFNNATTITLVPTATQNIIDSQFNAGGPSSHASQFGGPVASVSTSLSWTEATSAAWSKVMVCVNPSTGTPILTTQAPTSITATTATGNGTLLNNGTFSVSEEGCVLAAGHIPTTADTKVTASGTPFTCSFTGLTAGTGYHVRAYAINSEGTDYGADIPFATPPTKLGVYSIPGTGSMTIIAGTGSGVIR